MLTYFPLQGVDPVVRDIRKYTSKEVLKVQSKVDVIMALISHSPQVVSKEVMQATPLSTGDDGTKAVEQELPPSDVTKNEPSKRPVGKPQEQVEDLLRKLLNMLPRSGCCEGTEAVDVGELIDGDDSALISEVVRRLSFLKEHQKENNADISRLNKLDEFSAETCAHGHIEGQEEAVVSEFRASEDSSVDVLQSLSTAHEESRRSTMADESAYHNIFEPTTSIDSAVEGEVSHVEPEVGEEREETNSPISERATSPSELELHNLVETVATNFVDVVLTHNEDAFGSVQSMADNKENISLEGQDTTWHKVSVDGIGVPPQSVGVEDSNGMAESPKLVNVESELEGTSYLGSTGIAGGETQTEASVTYPAVVDGKDTRGMSQAFKVDSDGGCLIILSNANRHADDEEGLHTLCRSECGTDNQSDFLMDAALSDNGEILCQDITGDNKEKFFELGAHEECRCKGSTMASIEEETTNYASTKFLSNEEDVQDIDMRDGAALQQVPLTEVAYDSSARATLPRDDENTVNEDSLEVEKDNEPEEASPLSSTDCSTEDNTIGLWNGLGSTCQDSPDVKITLQSVAQDSEEVAPESVSLAMDEPCDCDQHESRSSYSSGQSVPPEDDVVEVIKVQIPNKSVPSQGERVDTRSPTSVLDAAEVSVAPAEDVLSVAEIILDDTTASIQVVITVDKSGVNMEQSRPDSSVNEEEVLQLQSAISDLKLLNNAGAFFLNDESLQLESAITDLHSLNNTGQGFLNDLNPVEDGGNVAISVVRRSSLTRIAEEVCLPKPPSLSAEALHILEGGVSPGDVCERLCPSSVSSPSSETELTLTQHLIEENTVLKELVKDVLKWSQWQSSATLSLHKMMERLALEVLETKTTAKRAAKCKQARNKKAVKKKTHKLS